ncbi:MAG: hypothetical protein K0S65_46, partial [Labilithrix sp.]|nr:hypothetical protein [Labilithrix sp.]
EAIAANGRDVHSAAPNAPTGAEAKRAVERSLKDAMRGRDTDLGLGPEGPILRALQDATYSGFAPERGGATFLAVVDTNGIVVDLRLLGSRGGRGWEDTRARAARSLSGVKLALRGAKGTELTIEIESDVRLPSGAKPDAPPVSPTLTESHVVLPENAPSDGTTSGVVQTYTLGVFDLADIKAKPRRIVHARLVRLSEL